MDRMVKATLGRYGILPGSGLDVEWPNGPSRFVVAAGQRKKVGWLAGDAAGLLWGYPYGTDPASRMSSGWCPLWETYGSPGFNIRSYSEWNETIGKRAE